MHRPKHKLTAVSAVIVFLLLACGNKDDAAAIRQLIDKGAELAEAHRIGDLMEMAADGFTASPGGHNARSVSGILFVAFKHYGTFDIRYPRPSVDVKEGAVTADATIHFMIISQDKPMPELKDLYEDPQAWMEKAAEKADLYRLKLDLVRNKGDWQVQKADLSTLKGMAFSASDHHIR